MSGGPIFPTNPTVGQIYTFGTTSWQWNGTQWVNATAGQNFLPLAGGTLTGPLVLPGNAAAPLQAVPLQQVVPVGGGAFTGPVALAGVTNGSNAAAGQVGEIQTASNTVNGVGSATAVNAVSLTLQAGDWDVSGWVYFSGTNQMTTAVACLNLTSLSLAGQISSIGISNLSTGMYLQQATFPLALMRVSVTTSTVVYLVAEATQSAGQANITGGIMARRVR